MLGSKREALKQLFDTARVSGAAYLLAIASLGQMTIHDLTDLTGDSDVTITKYLLRMESRHIVVRVRNGKADHWNLAPNVAQLLLLPKFLVAPSSSSDPDLALSDQPDQIRSEEEGELPRILAATPEDLAERKIKAYLAERHYHLNGRHLIDYVDDDWITAIDFEAWLYQIGEMKRNGVKIKFPEAYALQCLRRRHLPDRQWQIAAEREIEMKLRYYEAAPETESPDPRAA